ncbi:glycosyltransferase family A protein [uncultured Limosilactobacillus sp.]|uniref:glycosyltransferase family 2 protein n=1 Tax=uncultured Limosilactobacillus sp. TaxID=2837629 RepID=UPI0025D40497|nr:glycosyltransferase family A protein [uncultured Limosilactobacillus sp.]
MQEESAPLISVIIPAYNVERYITKSINSILNQTYRNIEVVVIDDGSTDRTKEIIANLARKDTRIKLYTQENSGVADARKRGIDLSHGKYISFVDPDDVVTSDYIQYMFQLLRNNNFNSKVALCTLKDIFSTGAVIDHGDGTEKTLSNKNALEMMCYNDRVDTCCVAKLVDSSLYKSSQFVGFQKGKLFEDMGTTYSLFEQSPTIECGFVSKYKYFIRNNSITTSKFNIRKLDLLEMTDQMANSVNQQFPELKSATLRRQAYARFSTLNQTLDASGDKVKSAQKSMVTFLHNHRKQVLSDPKTPKRDRVAFYMLTFGLPFYKFSWKAYLKFVKKAK